MSNRAYKISTSKGRRVKPLFVQNRKQGPGRRQRKAAAEQKRRERAAG